MSRGDFSLRIDLLRCNFHYTLFELKKAIDKSANRYIIIELIARMAVERKD